MEFSGPPGSGQPNLFATPDGRVLLTWHEPNGAGGYDLKIAERRQGSWSEPKTVASAKPFFVNWADFPSAVELEDGTWVVHWLQKVAPSTYAYHVYAAISSDRGESWRVEVVPHRDRSPTEHGFVSMVPWEGGTALVWLDGREMRDGGGHGEDGGEGAMTLRFTTLAADGSLGEEILLDGRTCECCQTAMVRTARGLLVAYRDRTEEEIRDIHVVRLEGGRWTEPQRAAEDNWHFPACPVNGPALSARGDAVALAWFTGSGGEPKVYVAFSKDGGASFGAPIRVDGGRPVGRVDVEWISGGAVLVSWLEAGSEHAEIRVRLVGNGGKLGEPQVLALSSEARSSGFPRMVVAGGELVFAWVDPGEAGGVRAASAPLVGAAAPAN
ncbi:MAG: hypothetical protein KatS3mg081_2562 [Gemmatimonadales bacterium]|nr:MAG: hypothetical protein KatS3mg081_2562 [Gemmatimonadales bacterium]